MGEKKKLPKYSFEQISAYQVKKDKFLEKLAYMEQLENKDALQQEIKSTLENKGRVYGIRDGKHFIGIYIFQCYENYFEEVVNLNQDMEPDKMEKYEKEVRGLYGSNKNALVLSKKLVLNQLNEVLDTYEEDILQCLKASVDEMGYAGFEWKDKVYYHGSMKAGKMAMSLMGTIGLYAMGFLFGYTVFHQVSLGLCYALLVSGTWGSLFMMSAKKKFVEIQKDDKVQKNSEISKDTEQQKNTDMKNTDMDKENLEEDD